jgi:hypothetical protein
MISTKIGVKIVFHSPPIFHPFVCFTNRTSRNQKELENTPMLIYNTSMNKEIKISTQGQGNED